MISHDDGMTIPHIYNIWYIYIYIMFGCFDQCSYTHTPGIRFHLVPVWLEVPITSSNGSDLWKGWLDFHFHIRLLLSQRWLTNPVLLVTLKSPYIRTINHNYAQDMVGICGTVMPTSWLSFLWMGVLLMRSYTQDRILPNPLVNQPSWMGLSGSTNRG